MDLKWAEGKERNVPHLICLHDGELNEILTALVGDWGHHILAVGEVNCLEVVLRSLLTAGIVL